MFFGNKPVFSLQQLSMYFQQEIASGRGLKLHTKKGRSKFQGFFGRKYNCKVKIKDFQVVEDNRGVGFTHTERRMGMSDGGRIVRFHLALKNNAGQYVADYFVDCQVS